MSICVGCLYGLSTVMSLIAESLYRRNLVTRNLRKAFPLMDNPTLRKLRRRFYQNLTDVLVEQILTPLIPEDDFQKRVRITNPEVLCRSDGLVLMFAMHSFNWEWLGHGVNLCTGYTLYPVAQTLRNRWAHRLMDRFRSRFGAKPLKKNTVLRFAKSHLKEKVIVGLIADQRPRANARKYWMTLLGVETAFSQGIVQLPYHLQVSCYFAGMRRVSRGNYQAELIPLGDPPYGKHDEVVLKNYVEEMEKWIGRYPEGWLWSHNRWKYGRGETEELIIL